jgi:hypothetical protein
VRPGMLKKPVNNVHFGHDATLPEFWKTRSLNRITADIIADNGELLRANEDKLRCTYVCVCICMYRTYPNAPPNKMRTRSLKVYFLISLTLTAQIY